MDKLFMGIFGQAVLLNSLLMLDGVASTNSFILDDLADFEQRINQFTPEQLLFREPNVENLLEYSSQDVDMGYGFNLYQGFDRDAEVEVEGQPAAHKSIGDESIVMANSDDCRSSQRTIKDYNNKYFWQRPKCPFSEVDIGLNDVDGRLMALGFLNNDPKPQRIDLVSVNDHMNSFRVHMFDGNHRYEESELYKIDGDDAYVSSIQIAKDQTILRSLIITYWKEKPVTGKENTFMKVFKQTKKMEFESEQSFSPDINGLELLGNIQPLWLDIDSDMVTDFLFQDSKDKKIKVALGRSKDSSRFAFREFKDMILSSADDSNCLDFNGEDEISSPHSNTFVDLNGDCIPDIFLTRIEQSTGELYYEVYIQKLVKKQSKYCLVQTKQKLIRDDFPVDKSSKSSGDGDSKDEKSGSNEKDDSSGKSGQGKNKQGGTALAEESPEPHSEQIPYQAQALTSDEGNPGKEDESQTKSEPQIRLLSVEEKRASKQSAQIPLLYFIDIDMDSQVDMIFYHNGHLFTFLNRLKAKVFNTGSINDEQNLCHDQENSTVTQESVIFEDITKLSVEELKNGGSNYIQVQDLEKTIKNKPFDILDIADPLSDKPFETSNGRISQGRIRLEDLDLNGLPDILVSFLVQDKKTKKKSYYSTLLMNSKLKYENRSLGGEFRESSDYTDVQAIAGEKSSLIVPLDVDENGRLDFLTQHVNDDKKLTNGFSMIYNNIRKEQDDQNFFLKLMVLYDRTQPAASSNGGTTMIDSKANVASNQQDIYGDLISGASLRFVASDLDYTKFARVGSQQNQMSYNSLMMPYIYLGVGETSNYFESMSVGLAIKGESKVFTTTPIIPKSQLILYANDQEPVDWNFIMFTDPGEKMYLILLGCGIVLVVLGIIIVVKHNEEKHEDERLRPRINFDFF